MQKNKALLPLIRLVQFNQWACVAVVTAVTVFFSIAIIVEVYEPMAANTWLVLGPSVLFLISVFAFLLLLFILPPFLIFKHCARLLKKYHEREFVDLGAQKEVKLLRRYLCLQFVLNVAVAAAGFPKAPTAPLPAMDASTEMYVTFFEKFAQVLGYASWVTISLQHAMPLIFLLLLYVAVGLSRESARMRSELEEVV